MWQRHFYQQHGVSGMSSVNQGGSPKRPKLSLRGEKLRSNFSANKQGGLSLLELLIGITVGLIILAGVIATVSKTSFSGLENVRMIQLDQQLRGAMDFIQRDLQRAGYANAWNPAPADPDPSLLDYLDVDIISLFGSVTLDNCTGTLCKCVLFSYDRDSDGFQGVGSGGTAGTGQDDDNFELYGFRLSNGAIQMRVGGDAHECGSGTWRGITDASINVTGLTFQHDVNAADNIQTYVVYDLDDDSCTAGANCSCLANPGDCTCQSGDTCLERRKLNIAIDGELVTDPDITVSIRNQVKIKNDYYYVAP